MPPRVQAAAGAANAPRSAAAVGAASGERKKSPALDEFCRDLVAEALAGRIDPVIGRDFEVGRLETLPCYALVCCAVLCCCCALLLLPCCAVLCCCCAVLYHAVLCCAVLLIRRVPGGARQGDWHAPALKEPRAVGSWGLGMMS